MSIHPSGDFLAVTTEGPVVRFYDINTCQCYVCPYPREHHTGPLTSVRYSADARVCASASKDGDIKIWDGVSGRCVQTFTKCHDGAEVCSVLFSRNGKVKKINLVLLGQEAGGGFSGLFRVFLGLKITKPSI